LSDDLIWLPSDHDHDPGGKVRLLVPRDIKSEAIYSDCKLYRYLLRREWSHTEPRRAVLFIMLNPSTATTEVDDPTVRKCRSYARQWGFNTLLVGNLMAYRTTFPSLLRGADDPVGPDNLRHLAEQLRNDVTLVCAWGKVSPRFAHTENAVIQLIRDSGITPHVLRLNITGGPWHPLYLPMALEPQVWTGVLSHN
jgi:hypothetical protein